MQGSVDKPLPDTAYAIWGNKLPRTSAFPKCPGFGIYIFLGKPRLSGQ